MEKIKQKESKIAKNIYAVLIVFSILNIMSCEFSSSWKLHTTYTIEEALTLEILSINGSWADSPNKLGFSGIWGKTEYATKYENDGTTSIICWWHDNNGDRYSLVKYNGNWEKERGN